MTIQKKLKVRVNLWNKDARPDGEFRISGVIVHPANKSDEKHFKDTAELIAILKEFNKANVPWDTPPTTTKSRRKGLAFFLVLEPYDDNHHELHGIIIDADNSMEPEHFSFDRELIDIIEGWILEH